MISLAVFETKSLNLVKTPATLDAVFSRAALNSLRVGILSISKSVEFLGLHCQSLSVKIHMEHSQFTYDVRFLGRKAGQAASDFNTKSLFSKVSDSSD